MNAEHEVWTGDDPGNDERAIWECSCGSGGSGSAWNVDVASDKHIRYDEGERRVDTSRRPT